MSQQYITSHECTDEDKHIGPIWGSKWTAIDQVVTISADGSLVLWESRSGHALLRPAHQPLALTSVSCPTGRFALYNTIVGGTHLIDLSSGVEAAKKTTSSSDAPAAWSVSLHPNESVYAATGQKGIISFHSAQPEDFGASQHTISTVRSIFGMSIAYSPDGRRIAMSSNTGQIFMCDAESGSLLSTYSSHAACIRTIAWSADGQLLLSGSDDARLVLHDVRGHRGGTVAAFSGHKSWVLSADLSSDGRLAASGSADRTMRIWDLAQRACVSTSQEAGEVWSVSWRPQGGGLVTGGDDGIVRWWRGASSS